MDDWSKSFLSLRTVRGHFDGGPWTASVDRWGGERHQAMQCLAQHASSEAATAAQIAKWMGPPEQRLRCPSVECTAFSATAGNTSEVWVYHWRGAHDRLGFVMTAGRVRAASWAYVGE
ncbi:MAG: hypothetical protein H7Z15_23370 [Rhizobacter sp.]|nr:hypothetical protein [Rhizobacter sp.]